MRLLYFSDPGSRHSPIQQNEERKMSASLAADNQAILKFEMFDDDSASPYAILSHCWGQTGDEVSFQELCDGTAASKAGYEKIRRCGEIAAQEGLDYFWVDTCCIDKTSSADLSQAINSMFTWYKKAKICYAYLSDVSSTSGEHLNYPTISTFVDSRWFSRGWTLQELIAPSNLTFFSREWDPIGTKITLKDLISGITGIHSSALEGADLRTFSVAARMSWAAKRKTTQPEDIAYSLMGIFDVNMPLLYGEKEKSFIRLQEEIMKNSDDHSLFAWKDESIAPEEYRGLLATSPQLFSRSAKISSLGIWGKGSAYYVTNKGLRIELFLIPHKKEGMFFALLDCLYEDSVVSAPIIYLKRVSGTKDAWNSASETQFSRVRCGRLGDSFFINKEYGQYRTIFVRQDQIMRSQNFNPEANIFKVTGINHSPILVYPTHQWNPQTELLTSYVALGKAGGALFMHSQTAAHYMVIFGLSKDNLPWVHVLGDVSDTPYRDWIDYQPAGDEPREVTSETKFLRVDAVITSVTIHGWPVFQVQVTTNELE